MRKVFLVLLIMLSCYANVAMTKDEVAPSSRPSSFLVTGSKGPDSYQSLAVDMTVGITPSWSMNGSFFQSDSGVATLLNEKLISKEERLGADWQISKVWGTTFGVIGRQDPYEIISQGGYLSARADINHWWKGKKSTTISLKGEFLKIAQDLQVKGKFVTLTVKKYLEQKNSYISLNQEIVDWLYISLSHNRYSYSEESSSLGLTSAAKRTSMGGGALSYGYPESSNKLEFIVTPLEWLEVRLGGSTTNTLGSSSKTQTATLGTSFFWDKFQFDVEFSKTDYGSSSGSQSSNQSYNSIGLGYNW